jgi:hypothetical protein
MKYLFNLLEMLTFVGLLLGLALALALIIAALSWAIEAVLRHRIGFYLGYGVMFVVAFIILIQASFEIKDCGLFKFGYVEGICELSPLLQLLSAGFILITMPLVLVSQMKLKKWSQSR